jgi:hypothetical protein
MMRNWMSLFRHLYLNLKNCNVFRSLTRWLIPLPAIVLSFWPTLVRAEAQPGIATSYYTIDAIPPVQSVDEYPLCGTEVENNINRSYDGEPYLDCTYDMFMVHMTGFIDIPEHQTIEFMIASDDGGEITIAGNTFGVWWDQGCTWTMSNNLQLESGTQPLQLFMYENGGGTCLMLAWKVDDGQWEIVPDKAFTQQAVATTSSTSTSTTTTTTSTSTTVAESTTTSSTSSSTSTTVLPTTTTTTTEPVQTSTTTSTTSTTTTTTTTVAPAPTTTQAPYTPPQTTTSSSSTSLPEQSTTTTSVLPKPVTTVEETSTTVPVVIVPTVPESVPVQSSVTPTLPVETTPQTSQPSPETSIQETSSTTVLSSSTTTIPEPNETISDTKVAEILTELKTAAPAQIVAVIEQVLASNITSDQAVSIASSPEVLAAVTEQQAEAIFEEIVVEELTAEVAEELVEVLNEAPTKVKKAFQETINVFAGVFDSFQMVGQTIPVGERRTLVAVSNTLVAVGASLRRKNT